MSLLILLSKNNPSNPPYVNDAICNTIITIAESLSNNDKFKIHFIHLNHTNPAIIQGSKAYKKINEAGFNLANQKQIFNL